MAFALSHISLAQFWQRARLIEGRIRSHNEYASRANVVSDLPPSMAQQLPSQAAGTLLKSTRIEPLTLSALSHRRSDLIVFARENQLELPFDLMTFNRQTRRTDSKYFRCHLATSVASIPCVLRYENAYIGTPELCILQQLGNLSDIDLLRHLYEYCGSYVIDQASRRGFNSCTPLTDKESCQSFVSSVAKFRGTRKLSAMLEALPAGHSASPRETALSMILSTQPEHGGYGLAPLALNIRIELGSRARAVYGKNSCVCDLMFEGLDVEYDSAMEHDNIASSVSDSLRSTALALEGIEVVHVYNENLRTLERLDSLALTIARKLGQHLELDQSREGRAKREQLRHELLRPHKPLFQSPLVE